MSRKSIPHEKKYVLDRLRPVIEALRADSDLRNDFMRFAADPGRNADLFTMGERLRKVIFAENLAPMTPFFVLLLMDYGQIKGLLSSPEVKRLT